MDEIEQNRAHVLGVVSASVPLTFWQGLQDRARGLYVDVFNAIRNDPRLNGSQRPSMLWQKRHFEMEWLLIDEAKNSGLPASANLIVENRCAYALVGRGSVKVTQKYVRNPGAMPSPAKFRRQLAAVNAFNRESGLALGDQPVELFKPSEINGIILHSPVGTRFVPEHQMLGAIGLYVPYNDFRQWAVELTFAEIVAAYGLAAHQQDRVNPTLRRIRKTGDSE